MNENATPVGASGTSDAPADDHGTVLIVGAGPGIGLSVARRFGRAGASVGLIARDASRLADLAATLGGSGIRSAWETADATSPDALEASIGRLTSRLGPIDTLCFSPIPDLGLIGPVLQTTPAEYLRSLELGVVGAAAAVRSVVSGMRDRGSGALLFTTGSGALRPSPDRAASAVTTAATTAYVDLLHRELEPSGIRVAQLAIVGPVGPGREHEPDDVAEELWTLRHSSGPALSVLD